LVIMNLWTTLLPTLRLTGPRQYWSSNAATIWVFPPSEHISGCTWLMKDIQNPSTAVGYVKTGFFYERNVNWFGLPRGSSSQHLELRAWEREAGPFYGRSRSNDLAEPPIPTSERMKITEILEKLTCLQTEYPDNNNWSARTWPLFFKKKVKRTRARGISKGVAKKGDGGSVA
jgi:hypothetical protein